MISAGMRHSTTTGTLAAAKQARVRHTDTVGVAGAIPMTMSCAAPIASVAPSSLAGGGRGGRDGGTGTLMSHVPSSLRCR
jgi:hypothetical protein